MAMTLALATFLQEEKGSGEEEKKLAEEGLALLSLALSITPYFGVGKPILTFLFLPLREKQRRQGTWLN